MPWQKHDVMNSNRKPSLPMIADKHIRENNGDDDQCLLVDGIDGKLSHQSPKLDSPETQDFSMVKSMQRRLEL